MGFVSKRIESRGITDGTTFGYTDSDFLKLFGLDSQTLDSNKLGETTFFICLKHLSECVGKLPIYCYNYNNVKGKEKINNIELDNILNLEPNQYMAASTFWQTVELNRNYKGNAYVYIETMQYGKSKGTIQGLWILPSDEVTIYIDNKGLFGETNNIVYIWVDRRTGKRYIFYKDEILHYKSSVSFDGITGLAIKDILKTQIDSNRYSQSYLSNLYKNNMQGGKILLQYTGDLSTNSKDKLVKETERYANSVGTGKFLPIPTGITATELSMKLTDADYAELNKMSSLSIAAAFGIKPNILNNYDKSSYSNSVTQQLDFYVNSMHPIYKGYNEENTRKLLTTKNKNSGQRLEFYTKELFKLDPTAQMDYLQKGVNNAIITVEEAREELGYSYIEGTNILIGNGNLISWDNIINQQKGGIQING